MTKTVDEGLVPHPAGEILGEEILMCAECGAIDGHTAKCAVRRSDIAKVVGTCRHCELPATNGYDDLCSGHQRLLGVGPEYDVRADIAPNN